MASAWGNSWGTSWGNSWGTVAAPPSGPGGMFGHRYFAARYFAPRYFAPRAIVSTGALDLTRFIRRRRGRF